MLLLVSSQVTLHVVTLVAARVRALERFHRRMNNNVCFQSAGPRKLLVAYMARFHVDLFLVSSAATLLAVPLVDVPGLRPVAQQLFL